MITINNKSYSKEDVIKRNADRTIYGIKQYQLTGGKSGGLNMVEVHNAQGLSLDLCADRCLDITALTFKGVNMGYQSKNALVNPQFVNVFHDYMTGGMLFSSGLSTSGGGGDYKGEFQPFHGKINITPADNVCARIEGDACVISGTMQESVLFGRRLTLERKITVPLDKAAVIIEDTITNNTMRDEYYFMLYHYNYGFPFLDEGLTVTFPTDKVETRTDYAAKTLDEHCVMSAPLDNIEEAVFFHTFTGDAPKEAVVELINEKLGIKSRLIYETAHLPMLGEWKSMGSTDYALGIEPSTSSLKGRKGEIESGYDKILKPFESVSIKTALEFESL